MRALGRELGVSGMALYGYFANKDAIVAAVIERFAASMDTQPVPGEFWEDTLMRTMNSLRRCFNEHPAICELSLSEESDSAGWQAHNQRIITMHLEQGIPEDVFTQAWALIDTFLAGFADNERRQRALAAAGKAPSPAELSAMPIWQRIPWQAYSDESFNNGIRMIIASIRALAAPDPCEWYTPA
jgi:AcrR family transcriptional regulator